MRLADQLIAADVLGGGKAVALAVDDANAECFELSEEVRDASWQVAQAKPSSLLSALPLMRLPHAKTWIEWTGWPGATERVGQYGCLFDSPDGDLSAGIMSFAMAHPMQSLYPSLGRSRGIVVSPYAVCFEEGGRNVVQMFADALGDNPHCAKLHSLLSMSDEWVGQEMRAGPYWGRHAAAPDERRAALAPDERRAAHRLWQHAVCVPSAYFDEHRRTPPNKNPDLYEDLARGLSLVWPFAMSFVVMLNARGALETKKDDLSRLNWTYPGFVER